MHSGKTPPPPLHLPCPPPSHHAHTLPPLTHITGLFPKGLRYNKTAPLHNQLEPVRASNILLFIFWMKVLNSVDFKQSVVVVVCLFFSMKCFQTVPQRNVSAECHGCSAFWEVTPPPSFATSDKSNNNTKKTQLHDNHFSFFMKFQPFVCDLGSFRSNFPSLPSSPAPLLLILLPFFSFYGLRSNLSKPSEACWACSPST